MPKQNSLPVPSSSAAPNLAPCPAPHKKDKSLSTKQSGSSTKQVPQNFPPALPANIGITVNPMPLNSLAEICKAVGRCRNTVVGWYNAGAPIYSEGKGTKRRYAAEYNLLYAWLLARSKKDVN